MVLDDGPNLKHIKLEKGATLDRLVEEMMEAGLGHNTSLADSSVASAADAMLELSNSTPKPTYLSDDLLLKKTSPSAHQPQGAITSSSVIKEHLQSTSNFSKPVYSDGEPSLTVKMPLNAITAAISPISRKNREFTPEFRKDDQYWMKRRKNNEAAKKSREKRRLNDVVMGQKIMELTEDNNRLVKELEAIKRQFGLPIGKPFVPDEGLTNSTLVGNGSSVSNSFSSVTSTSATPQSKDNVSIPAVIPATIAQQLNKMPVAGMNTSSSARDFPPGMPPLIPINTGQSVITVPPGTTRPGSSTTSHSSVGSTDGSEIGVAKTPGYQNRPDKATPASYLPREHPQTSQENSEFIPTQAQNRELYQQETSAQTRKDWVSKIDSTSNEAVRFHSQMKAQDIYQPISPVSSEGSPHSLTISFSNSDTSDTEGTHIRKGNFMRSPSQGNISQPISDEQAAYEYMSRARERKGIPHKLRHKMGGSTFDDFYQNTADTEQSTEPTQAGQSVARNTGGPSISDSGLSGSFSINGTQLQHGQPGLPASVAARMHHGLPGAGHENTSYQNNFFMTSSVSLNNTEGKSPEESVKYIIRRQRNNLAARKCRENRKFLNKMRLAKADVLESENTRLKDEIGSLSAEVSNLKQLMEKKREAEAKGEKFELPPLDDMEETSGYMGDAQSTSDSNQS